MDVLTAGTATGALTLAAVGGGAAVLAALGLWRGRGALERTALAFAIGYGLLGWLFFWVGAAGLLVPSLAWAMAGVLATGLLFFKVPAQPVPKTEDPYRPALFLMFGLLAIAFGADVIESVAPPLDADTLAYHFEMPRRFVEAGELLFTPRAANDAGAHIDKMTYAWAYLLGGRGELALTFWTLISGWGASLLLFVLARRWLAPTPALGLMLIYQTLPAMIYGAGAGQVEPRHAMFVLIAAFGLIEAWRTNRLAPVVLVGLGAGFYAAGKYTGLLFLPAAGIPLLLIGRGWFKRGAVYTAVAVLAGAQWYVWLFIHSGDPVFPILFDALGLQDNLMWDQDQNHTFQSYMTAHRNRLTWWERWLTYPVTATLAGATKIEALRVGFGPFFLLIAPVAVYRAWAARKRIFQSRLFPLMVCTIVFYVLWIAFQSISNVRFLLPVLPLLLVCMGVAIWKKELAWTRRPMMAAWALSIAVHFGAVFFYTKSYLPYVFGDETRTAFLTRLLNTYDAVPRINARTDIDRLLHVDRQIAFYIRPPAYQAEPNLQNLINTHEPIDAADLWRESRAFGISHVFAIRETNPRAGTLSFAINQLVKKGCLEELEIFTATHRVSRTVAGLGSATLEMAIWRLRPETCLLR